MAKFEFLIINEKTLNILKSLTEPKNFNELLAIIKGSYGTLKDYVDGLIQRNYIREKRMKVFPYKRTMTLTAKGKKTLKIMETMP